jgi:hypothetical protein
MGMKLAAVASGLVVGYGYGLALGLLSLLSFFACLAGYALGVLSGRLMARVVGYHSTELTYRLGLIGILIGFAACQPGLLTAFKYLFSPIGFNLVMTWVGFAIFVMGVRNGFGAR